MKPQTPQGITTRSKEHQTYLHSNKKNYQNSNYPTLKKYDDFYKEKKNLQNEMYVYQPPRVDRNLYQVDFSLLEKEQIQPPLNKKYEDLNKVNRDDLDYYMKFIEYYDRQAGNDNIYLRGVHSVEERALSLLKTCNYDINVAMSKILFPVMDQLNCLDHPKKDKSLYLSNALNDLIGANAKDKEEWQNFMNKRLNNKISLTELEKLIEIGVKMKIEIPSLVESEKRNAMQFSKNFKELLSKKNNSLIDIKNLYEISQTYKVQTEEFYQVGDSLKRAEIWKTKVKEIEGQCVSYKLLQTLYNEGRLLPFKFEGTQFEDLKTRYEEAQEWHRLFGRLPKHSKTRQQGTGNQTERNNLEFLRKMIETASRVNFTSSEVENLKKNYELLDQEEKKIRTALEDDNVIKTKELLQEFLNSLDNLRFTTSLYDEVESKLALLEWKEKKEAFINSNNTTKQGNNSKFIKMKHFKHLIKFAEQKNLNNIQEIIEFKQMYNAIDEWIDTVSPIFYNSGSSNTTDSVTKDANQNAQNNTQNKKATYDELLELYHKGKKFEYKPEECEFLLNKCKEFFDFVDECGKAINVPNNQEDFTTLYGFLEQINQYNIQCKEFDYILAQINSVQSWIEKAESFFTKYSELNKLKFNFDNLVSIDCRKANIDLLDQFVKNNTTFKENLAEIMEQVPVFAKNSQQYKQLDEIKNESEKASNTDLTKLDTLEQVSDFIIKCQIKCVPKKFFEDLIKKYQSKSLSKFLTSQKNKLNFADAQGMLKEADSLGISLTEIQNLKSSIYKTNTWIRQKKEIFKSDKISYNGLVQLIEEGKKLPLTTNEVEELNNFKDAVENEKLQIRHILLTKHTYDEITEISNKVNRSIVDKEEFDVLNKLKNVSDYWTEIANKIISSRQLCQLYFKKKEPEEESQESNKNENNISSNSLHQEINIDIEENSGYNGINDSHPINNQINNENSNSLIEIKVPQNHQIKTDENENRKDEANQNNGVFLGKKRKCDPPLSQLKNINNNSTSKDENENFQKNYSKNSDEILSRFQNTQLSLSECENLLKLINSTPNQKNTNQKLTAIDKSAIKKFQNFSYEERYNFLSQRLILKEDTGEQFCICLKGDDSVNYMIMCENCERWFHGKCIKLPKSNADLIKQYYCLCCSRRKDCTNTQYHSAFYSQKRAGYDELLEFISEGEKYMAIFPQMEALYNIKNKAASWIERYNQALEQIVNHYMEGEHFLNDTLDKLLTSLYLESEGFCVEIKNQDNIILILKQSDWFKEAFKCIEGKKNSEKNLKKLLTNTYTLFNYDFISIYNDIEKKYFDFIVQKGNRTLLDLTLIYQNSSLGALNSNHLNNVIYN